MPVPKSRREQTPLTVLIEASTLASYTIRICTNEDKFPKRYRWCLTKDIVSAAVKTSACIARANAVYVNNVESYKLRRAYQQQAIAELAAMESTMNIAFNLFDGLRHTGEEERQKKRVNIASWTSQLIKTKAQLLAWKKSDAEHFKNMANR